MSIIFNSADIAETMNNGVSNVTGADSIITENYTNVVQHGIKIDMSVSEKTISGTPPLAFNSNGESLIDFTIYGNSIQDGTPTPNSPASVNSVGNDVNGNYTIPVITNTTTHINLNNVPTTRVIKKLVLDGTETWIKYSSTPASYLYYLTELSRADNSYCICTHMSYSSTVPNDSNAGVRISDSQNTLLLNCGSTTIKNNTTKDFKAWLASQHANGTPVCVWYVLAKPTKGIVNEPLRKIGTYADTLSMEQSGVTIPTAIGSNTINVQTTPKPSNISITYKGR